MRVSRPQPFLEAAAQAMGVEQLRLIETGLDPLAAPRQQWDDGGNALAVDRGVVVCHERNVETNARLEAAGIEVIRVPAGELGSRRGGPRCMVCPVTRRPAASADAGLAAEPDTAVQSDLAGLPEAVTQPHGSAQRPLARLASR